MCCLAGLLGRRSPIHDCSLVECSLLCFTLPSAQFVTFHVLHVAGLVLSEGLRLLSLAGSRAPKNHKQLPEKVLMLSVS